MRVIKPEVLTFTCPNCGHEHTCHSDELIISSIQVTDYRVNPKTGEKDRGIQPVKFLKSVAKQSVCSKCSFKMEVTHREDSEPIREYLHEPTKGPPNGYAPTRKMSPAYWDRKEKWNPVTEERGVNKDGSLGG